MENAEKGDLPYIDDKGNVTSENTGNTVLTVNGERNFLAAPYPSVIEGKPAEVHDRRLQRGGGQGPVSIRTSLSRR